MVFKTEGGESAGKYLGLIIGFARGIIISGFVIFGLLISTIRYCDLSARSSFFGPKVTKITTQTYEFAFYGIISKIFPDQSFNQEVTKVTAESQKKL
jgi:glycerol-3-phosphate acyltransferase PlsY